MCFVIFVVSSGLLLGRIVAYIYNVCCFQVNLTLSPYLHVISYKRSSHKFESRINLLAYSSRNLYQSLGGGPTAGLREVKFAKRSLIMSPRPSVFGGYKLNIDMNK